MACFLVDRISREMGICCFYAVPCRMYKNYLGSWSKAITEKMVTDCKLTFQNVESVSVQDCSSFSVASVLLDCSLNVYGQFVFWWVGGAMLT